ncbi:hypothetical protein [Olleya namhaensis]|uniref:hypothetical protein n=1 Tax=Olleya namhaensis TaxID=1144750 RepID=UPI00249029E6|nr:hypothetical protein [Olleya namhaensis]
MKFIKIIIILLLIFNCSDKKTEHKPNEFDEILGTENTNTLNLLVSEFENGFLKTQYPNLGIENAYKKFLTETSEGKIKHSQAITEKSKNIFNKSQLRLEIFCIADSTWIEKNPWNDKTLLVKARTQCKKSDGTFEKGAMTMPFDEKEISKDSILEKYMNSVRTNHNGKYIKALNSIAGKSEFLSSFVTDRNDFGIIPFYFTAERILANKVDLNDYYIRRIIIAEMSN